MTARGKRVGSVLAAFEEKTVEEKSVHSTTSSNTSSLSTNRSTSEKKKSSSSRSSAAAKGSVFASSPTSSPKVTGKSSSSKKNGSSKQRNRSITSKDDSSSVTSSVTSSPTQSSTPSSKRRNRVGKKSTGSSFSSSPGDGGDDSQPSTPLAPSLALAPAGAAAITTPNPQTPSAEEPSSAKSVSEKVRDFNHKDAKSKGYSPPWLSTPSESKSHSCRGARTIRATPSPKKKKDALHGSVHSSPGDLSLASNDTASSGASSSVQSLRLKFSLAEEENRRRSMPEVSSSSYRQQRDDPGGGGGGDSPSRHSRAVSAPRMSFSEHSSPTSHHTTTTSKTQTSSTSTATTTTTTTRHRRTSSSERLRKKDNGGSDDDATAKSKKKKSKKDGKKSSSSNKSSNSKEAENIIQKQIQELKNKKAKKAQEQKASKGSKAAQEPDSDDETKATTKSSSKKKKSSSKSKKSKSSSKKKDKKSNECVGEEDLTETNHDDEEDNEDDASHDAASSQTSGVSLELQQKFEQRRRSIDAGDKKGDNDGDETESQHDEDVVSSSSQHSLSPTGRAAESSSTARDKEKAINGGLSPELRRKLVRQRKDSFDDELSLLGGNDESKKMYRTSSRRPAAGSVPAIDDDDDDHSDHDEGNDSLLTLPQSSGHSAASVSPSSSGRRSTISKLKPAPTTASSLPPSERHKLSPGLRERSSLRPGPAAAGGASSPSSIVGGDLASTESKGTTTTTNQPLSSSSASAGPDDSQSEPASASPSDGESNSPNDEETKETAGTPASTAAPSNETTQMTSDSNHSTESKTSSADENDSPSVAPRAGSPQRRGRPVSPGWVQRKAGTAPSTQERRSGANPPKQRRGSILRNSSAQSLGPLLETGESDGESDSNEAEAEAEAEPAAAPPLRRGRRGSLLANENAKMKIMARDMESEKKAFNRSRSRSPAGPRRRAARRKSTENLSIVSSRLAAHPASMRAVTPGRVRASPLKKRMAKQSESGEPSQSNVSSKSFWAPSAFKNSRSVVLRATKKAPDKGTASQHLQSAQAGAALHASLAGDGFAPLPKQAPWVKAQPGGGYAMPHQLQSDNSKPVAAASPASKSQTLDESEPPADANNWAHASDSAIILRVPSSGDSVSSHESVSTTRSKSKKKIILKSAGVSIISVPKSPGTPKSPKRSMLPEELLSVHEDLSLRVREAEDVTAAAAKFGVKLHNTPKSLKGKISLSKKSKKSPIGKTKLIVSTPICPGTPGTPGKKKNRRLSPPRHEEARKSPKVTPFDLNVKKTEILARGVHRRLSNSTDDEPPKVRRPSGSTGPLSLKPLDEDDGVLDRVQKFETLWKRTSATVDESNFMPSEPGRRVVYELETLGPGRRSVWRRRSFSGATEPEQEAPSRRRFSLTSVSRSEIRLDFIGEHHEIQMCHRRIAAIKIQAVARGWLHRHRKPELSFPPSPIAKRPRFAPSRKPGLLRQTSLAASMSFNEKTMLRPDFVREHNNLRLIHQERGATRIQALVRGKLQRQKFRIMVLERQLANIRADTASKVKKIRSETTKAIRKQERKREKQRLREEEEFEDLQQRAKLAVALSEQLKEENQSIQEQNDKLQYFIDRMQNVNSQYERRIALHNKNCVTLTLHIKKMEMKTERLEGKVEQLKNQLRTRKGNVLTALHLSNWETKHATRFEQVSRAIIEKMEQRCDDSRLIERLREIEAGNYVESDEEGYGEEEEDFIEMTEQTEDPLHALGDATDDEAIDAVIDDVMDSVENLELEVDDEMSAALGDTTPLKVEMNDHLGDDGVISNNDGELKAASSHGMKADTAETAMEEDGSEDTEYEVIAEDETVAEEEVWYEDEEEEEELIEEEDDEFEEEDDAEGGFLLTLAMDEDDDDASDISDVSALDDSFHEHDLGAYIDEVEEDEELFQKSKALLEGRYLDDEHDMPGHAHTDDEEESVHLLMMKDDGFDDDGYVYEEVVDDDEATGLYSCDQSTIYVARSVLM